MTLDVSSLSPSDAAVALRSYPRRFRAVLTGLEPDEEVVPEAVAAASDYGRLLAQLRNGLRRVLAGTGDAIPAGVLDESQRQWAMPADDDVARVLDVLTEESEGLAAQIDAVAADDWSRTAPVTGGGTVSAVDLVREAVRVGHGHLRTAEQAMRRSRDR